MSVALSNPPTPAFDPADKTASAENASAEVGFAHRSHSAGGAGPSEGPAYEDDWLGRCRQGDLAAWRQLYDQQFERVYRLVQRLGVPERDAADVCQEVFLRVHRGLGRFRGDAQIGTWLFRIALNESRRWGRLRGVRQALLALYSREPVVAPGQPDDVLARAEGWRELGALLGAVEAQAARGVRAVRDRGAVAGTGERGAGRGGRDGEVAGSSGRAPSSSGCAGSARCWRWPAVPGDGHERSVERAGADPRRRPRGGPGAAARGPARAAARAAGPGAPIDRAADGGPAIPPLVGGRPVRAAGRGHRLRPGQRPWAATAARPAGSAAGGRGPARVGGPPARLAAAARTTTTPAADPDAGAIGEAAAAIEPGAAAPGGRPATGPAPAARRVVDVRRRRRARSPPAARAVAPAHHVPGPHHHAASDGHQHRGPPARGRRQLAPGGRHT